MAVAIRYDTHYRQCSATFHQFRYLVDTDIDNELLMLRLLWNFVRMQCIEHNPHAAAKMVACGFGILLGRAMAWHRTSVRFQFCVFLILNKLASTGLSLHCLNASGVFVEVAGSMRYHIMNRDLMELGTNYFHEFTWHPDLFVCFRHSETRIVLMKVRLLHRSCRTLVRDIVERVKEGHWRAPDVGEDEG